MTMSTRELAQRQTDGVEVVLLWQTGRDRLTVAVHDSCTGDDFELDIEPANAMDAFRHPYAYAASRGIPYRAGRRAGAALVDAYH